MALPEAGTPSGNSAERTVVRRLGLLKEVLRDSKEDGMHLDVGCGLGVYLDALLKDGRPGVGIDVNNVYLASAKRNPTLRGALFRMDVHSLAFRDGCFASCSLIEVLEHVRSPEAALREVARVLKTNAILFLSVPYSGFPFETHGIRIHGKVRGFGGMGIPLLPYAPDIIRRRFASARVFGRKELFDLLRRSGFQVVAVRFLLPSLDVLERHLPFGHLGVYLLGKISSILRRLESLTMNRFGSTIVFVCKREDRPEVAS